jgi:hypothetical protein
MIVCDGGTDSCEVEKTSAPGFVSTPVTLKVAGIVKVFARPLVIIEEVAEFCANPYCMVT